MTRELSRIIAGLPADKRKKAVVIVHRIDALNQRLSRVLTPKKQ